MKARLLMAALMLLAAGPSALLHAEGPQLSADRLDLLDERGYFTPDFKAAVHDLVNARQEVVKSKMDEKNIRATLPDLRKQSADAQAEVARLQKELDLYAHPEDADYDALQRAMKDDAMSPAQRLALAQAFVWSYPTDPHQADAEQDLRQIQKQLADQQQAQKDADAARVAARAKLVQRAAAKDLSLAEWQGFLQDMSQQELLNYLGHPEQQTDDYWIYTGDWTSDPVTKAKVGLRVHFNGTRVISVVPEPHR